jgi:hypothetical protein
MRIPATFALMVSRMMATLEGVMATTHLPPPPTPSPKPKPLGDTHASMWIQWSSNLNQDLKHALLM